MGDNDEFCLGHDDSKISFRNNKEILNRKLSIIDERPWLKREMYHDKLKL